MKHSYNLLSFIGFIKVGFYLIDLMWRLSNFICFILNNLIFTINIEKCNCRVWISFALFHLYQFIPSCCITGAFNFLLHLPRSLTTFTSQLNQFFAHFWLIPSITVMSLFELSDVDLFANKSVWQPSADTNSPYFTPVFLVVKVWLVQLSQAPQYDFYQLPGIISWAG